MLKKKNSGVSCQDIMYNFSMKLLVSNL